jgi:hypothetical protein
MLRSERSDLDEKEDISDHGHCSLAHSRRYRVWCTGNAMNAFESSFVNGFQCLLCPGLNCPDLYASCPSRNAFRSLCLPLTPLTVSPAISTIFFNNPRILGLTFRISPSFSCSASRNIWHVLKSLANVNV